MEIFFAAENCSFTICSTSCGNDNLNATLVVLKAFFYVTLEKVISGRECKVRADCGVRGKEDCWVSVVFFLASIITSREKIRSICDAPALQIQWKF